MHAGNLGRVMHKVIDAVVACQQWLWDMRNYAILKMHGFNSEEFRYKRMSRFKIQISLGAVGHQGP